MKTGAKIYIGCIMVIGILPLIMIRPLIPFGIIEFLLIEGFAVITWRIINM